MNTITIQIKEASFIRSESHTITGVIYFDFLSYQFPGKDWNDFVTVVLNWWLSALKRITLATSVNEELRFMDGPFFVSIKKEKNDLCSIQCISDRKNKIIEFSGQYPISALLNGVINAAKITYAICLQNGWSDDDVVNLGKLVKELSR